MRCLYCGKELALLKRLTGGAEFCSDAHRQRYQAEYNELALSRLLQTQAAAGGQAGLPLGDDEFIPPPELVEEEVRPARNQRSAAPQARSVAPQARQAAPQAPLEDEAPGELAGPVPDMPSMLTLEQAIMAEQDPPFEFGMVTTLPHRDYRGDGDERLQEPRTAPQVEWEPNIEPGNVEVRPRERSLEVREFVRQAITPMVTLQQSSARDEVALEGAVGDSMEITNQPHPPAQAPALWQAGPLEAGSIPLEFGDLARLDFAVTGFEGVAGESAAKNGGGAGHVPLPAPAPKQAVQPAQAAPRPIETNWRPNAKMETPKPEVSAPVETAEAPVVEQAVAVETEQAPPPPATQPLTVTLHGLGTTAAKPAPVVSAGMPLVVEPQAPRSSALPLRSTMVLGPLPVAAQAPVNTPAASTAAPVASPAEQENSQDGKRLPPRPMRAGGSTKLRRPDVRVIPTSQPAAAQAPPAPQAPTIRKTVAPQVAAKPAAPEVQQAPKPVAKAPVAAPPPVEREEKRATPQPSGTKTSATGEIDLGLPTLHIEMREGPWQRLPGGVKLGLGAVIVLLISGFAYYALNSNKATATTTAKAVPTYQLGKQINTSGWIEDWAPADTLRRVTLLRGSQPFSDYRMEFSAQIQTKAIGWMFRGLNPKNYYVVKIEKIKAGLEPVVALVRYAVIDGKNEGRVEKPLPASIKVRVDTAYKIRFDAVGNLFAVWVQGEKIDEWRDSRLGSGGVGLYSEGDESAVVSGTVNVFELVSAK